MVMRAVRLARILFVVLGLFSLSCFSAGSPSFEEVKRDYEASDALLLDRNGVVLQALRMDKKVLRLPWVALDELSLAMRDTLVLAEDKNFYEHGGVDWKAVVSAAWDNVLQRANRGRGASTLTMQLAGLFDPSLHPAKDGSRTLTQKWDQMGAAQALEKTWSKAQILEAYFNLVPFRGELIGINAASQRLFGKDPSGLDRNESLLLAALLRGPNASADKVSRRACRLGRSLAQQVDCNALHDLALTSFESSFQLPQQDMSPHLARRLLAKPGEALRSTLSISLQRTALEAVQQHLLALKGRNVEDAAVVVLDNASGDVLAYVGSSGKLSAAGEVDGVVSLRQAGSTLKPFLYALALEQRLLTAASILDDSPLNLTTPSGLYIPQNYDKDFKGPVSLRVALASSLNVPAVRTLALLGLEPFHQQLRAVGLESLTESAAFYGYSLALGSAEVTLLSLSNAFRVLANGGVWKPARFRSTEAQGTGRRVMDARAAFIVADILSDKNARALTFGLDNALAVSTWAAVKTGTSKDLRDNWCIGFTDRYTVGVWVGNYSGASMWDVSGVTGAAPIWRDLVHYLHRDLPSRPPVAPAGLVARDVHMESAVESDRQEWFITGTEPGERSVRVAQAYTRTPHIIYPGKGTLIALDPDIPAGHQWLDFSASPALPGLRWELDGERLTSQDGQVSWQPVSGQHQLILLDQAGQALDKVMFEVRGQVAAPH
jgi:penicillin-binding protein 1C